ncbi:hypothetical protein HDU97_003175 [Phlyctochytrium planicorne]|nr:hypothetical protein HDU97_003175 [Phlyctochytrium planicorne]
MPLMREFIFLGTGTSGTIPNVICLTKEPPTCKVCISAATWTPNPVVSSDPRDNLPIYNKNKRRNTSGLYRYHNSDGEMRNILIDCGKTFLESALNWFVTYRIRKLDAVILTHGHADAMLGLDDLRQWTMDGNVQETIKIYLNKETMEVVARAFPYMVDTSKATGGGAVPTLQFFVFDEGRQGEEIPPFLIEELEVIPFEVEHGKYSNDEPYFSTGFRFGDFTYISDVNRISPLSRSKILGTRTLVIDALKNEAHPSHFGVPQAIKACIDFKPERAYFTGFCHQIDHNELLKNLKEHEGLQASSIHVEPAHDGLRIQL